MKKSKLLNIVLFLFIIFAIFKITNLEENLIKEDININTNKITNNETKKWNLILVNKDNPLSKSHKIKTLELSNGEKVDERIYPALQKMFDDMRSVGIYPVVTSGYRTYEMQEKILNDKIKEFIQNGYSNDKAKEMALKWVATPGTSEHELGLALDINSDGINSSVSDVYNWLLNNSYKYGFVKRYPNDKVDITGINNEPWHYRYVGVYEAKEMYDNNLCLEEYLNKVN